MITRIFRVLISLAMFVASPFVLMADARVTDSAKDMLAAGRIDDAINELNGRLAAAPSDAESSNLLCRAYFRLEACDRAESSGEKVVSLDPEISRFHLWLGLGYGEKA